MSWCAMFKQPCTTPAPPAYRSFQEGARTAAGGATHVGVGGRHPSPRSSKLIGARGSVRLLPGTSACRMSRTGLSPDDGRLLRSRRWQSVSRLPNTACTPSARRCAGSSGPGSFREQAFGAPAPLTEPGEELLVPVGRQLSASPANPSPEMLLPATERTTSGPKR